MTQSVVSDPSSHIMLLVMVIGLSGVQFGLYGHTSDKQNRTTAKRESDLLITSMITDWIGRHEVLLPINHKNYNFREKEK